MLYRKLLSKCLGGRILRKQAITYMKKNSQWEKILGMEWGGGQKVWGGTWCPIYWGTTKFCVVPNIPETFSPAAGQNVWGVGDGGEHFCPRRKLTLVKVPL